MSQGPARRLIEHVLDQLEREREALVEGRWSALADAPAHRERDLARLSAMPEAPELLDDLALLRAAATRNAALCRAALDGFAAGRRRAAEIIAGAGAMLGYDASGAPVTRGAPAPGGRRA